jgi:Fe-S-cluster containining protein
VGRDKDNAPRDGAPAAPWYAAGLRFACLPECGRCCTSHDGHDYVYLEEEDVSGLADHLKLSRDAFLRRYTSLDDGDLVLRMDRPECPFLDGWRCTVYEARPTQCRTFPFWPETLRSPSAWKRTRRFCPGIGEGKLHSLSVIRDHLSRRDPEGG